MLMGILFGFLSAIGVGGGSLLMLWLTLHKKMAQAEARTINLLFFIVSAGVVTWLRRKEGIVDFKRLLPAILAGCLSAGFFSRLGSCWEQAYLQKAFGILLLVIGLRELCYRPRKFK